MYVAGPLLAASPRGQVLVAALALVLSSSRGSLVV